MGGRQRQEKEREKGVGGEEERLNRAASLDREIICLEPSVKPSEKKRADYLNCDHLMGCGNSSCDQKQNVKSSFIQKQNVKRINYRQIKVDKLP